jgi:hypothetical protein
MRSTITKLSFAAMALLTFHMGSAQVDLVPGINYSYNPPGADGIITDLTVDVCNNESDPVFTFAVSMYLYDPNTTDHWIISAYNVPSLSGYSCNTISNWNIDINNTPGVPAGTFRLGIWVDSNDDITETDETNNLGLLAGTINYTPSAVGIQQQASAQSLLKDAAPNPAVDFTDLYFHLDAQSKVSLAIYDLAGKKVSEVVNAELAPGDHSYRADLKGLAPGFYFYRLTTDRQTCSKKLVVRS